MKKRAVGKKAHIRRYASREKGTRKMRNFYACTLPRCVEAANRKGFDKLNHTNDQCHSQNGQRYFQGQGRGYQGQGGASDSYVAEIIAQTASQTLAAINQGQEEPYNGRPFTPHGNQGSI